MKKMKALYAVAAVMVVITATVFAVFSDKGEDRTNVRFLNSMGIEVNGAAAEVQKIRIPDPFDLVYENYNKLQLECGFDLKPYAGMDGVRYTYIVTNYPEDIDDEVRANVICIQNKPVGGDVMTTALDGFMKPLNFMENR